MKNFFLKLHLVLWPMWFAGSASFCQESTQLWRLEVSLPYGDIPFHISMDEDGKVYALNAGEKLAFDRAEFRGDSLFLAFDLYDSFINAKIEGEELHGVYRKPASEGYRSVPLRGKLGDERRFHNPAELTPMPVAAKYLVTFGTGDSARPALGVFDVQDDKVTGSFLTSTGDYRFLQGNVVGDSLFLSANVGNAVLYKARIVGDSLQGVTYNAVSGPREWSAVADDTYVLPDPYSLTYLNEGYDRFDFTFADLDGHTVSLSDPRYQGKVTLVQILGSWCPNCMDEAVFIQEYRKKNPSLEVIGLAFERSEDYASRIRRYIERFEIDYPVLYAGKVSEASEKLPALNKVMSYPTTIIVDKKGVVRKIHTGFRGPGTGSYYQEYVEEFSRFIEKLQAE